MISGGGEMQRIQFSIDKGDYKYALGFEPVSINETT